MSPACGAREKRRRKREYQNRLRTVIGENARGEAQERSAVFSPPTVERRVWGRRHVQIASWRREVGSIAGGGGACVQGGCSYCGRRQERAAGNRVVEDSRIRGPRWSEDYVGGLPTSTLRQRPVSARSLCQGQGTEGMRLRGSSPTERVRDRISQRRTFSRHEPGGGQAIAAPG